ncbi:shikimate dehydrogenase [Pelagibacterales bacterium SAG-MED32]|nr:shikimate dehydrogenase [Pelagibacterales bacterium SAG-MED32]
MATDRTAVIGFPVDHSLSPIIHNHWIKELGLDIKPYEKINVDPNKFEEQINKLKAEGYGGLNVTVPLKELAFSISDETSSVSKKLRSVNTLSLNFEKIDGDNTDAVGFINSLDEKTIENNITNKKTLVLGAGGSARSLVYALNELGGHVRLFNRTLEKAQILLDDLSINSSPVGAEELDDYANSSSFIVNTTSLGQKAGEHNNILRFENIEMETFIYDLIYNPKRSSFLEQAEAKGLKVQNGLRMLIEQAACSFQIWHEIKVGVSEEIMSLLESV